MVSQKRDDRGGSNGTDVVDEASDESFPASDPPSWVPGTVGAPAHAAAVEPDKGKGATTPPVPRPPRR